MSGSQVMSDQVGNNQAAARWVAATVCPLTLQASQAQAAVRDAVAQRPHGGPFSGDEGGCPLSAEELRILRRELGVVGGVL